MKRRVPTCNHCGQRTGKRAKLLDFGLAHEPTEPIWCSIRCAAAHAGATWSLTEAEIQHWCRATGEWEHCGASECSGCNDG
jgi:hypothetical protein